MEYILVDSIGVKLRMTPKCHLEIAGQGIEYSWGYSKLRYCRYFNDEKANNVEKNVRAALCTSVLTKEQTDTFVQKARDYKLT